MAGETFLSRLKRLARRRPSPEQIALREERERQIKAILGPPNTKHIAGAEHTKNRRKSD